jgi:NADH-quinone oxidoreductase subunit M
VSTLPVLLVAVPLAGALLVAVWPGPVGDRYAARAGVGVSGLTLLLALVAVAGFDHGTPGRVQMETDVPWVPGLGLRFHLGVDGISLPLVALTALLTFCCLLYGLRHTPAPGRPRALVALLLVLEVGVLGTFLALDLLLFFVFFEVVLVPMYAVIAVWGGPGRRAAATKFILYTLLGSALMLVGFLVVWAHTGTLDMVALAENGGAGMSRGVQVAAFVAIGLGFAVKAPMWPLHTWLPDAHTEAPTVGSVLLAGVLLKMGTYGLVRIALPVLPAGAEQVAPWLGVLAVVGILYGSLVCLAQTDLKRLVAYSSVGHMGFVLLGIATLTPVGVNGALFANVAHGLVTGLLFFLVGAVKERTGSTDVVTIGGGLYARAPRLGSLVAFGAIASLGLPGLAGFWGEMLAMLGAFDPGAGLDRALFLVLMAGAGLGAVLTATYLLVMVRRVSQGPPERIGDALPDVARLEWAAWVPLVALAVALGLWPRALLGLSDPAVQNLPGVGS